MANIRELKSKVDPRAGVVERWLWDEDRQAVTVLLERLPEPEHPTPTLTNERSYRCLECKDKGLQQVAFEYTFGNRLIQTTTRAVCHCKEAQRYIGRYATVKDLTGQWRFNQALRVASPTPTPEWWRHH